MGEIANYAPKLVPLLRQKAVHYPYDYFIEMLIFLITKIFKENQWNDFCVILFLRASSFQRVEIEVCVSKFIFLPELPTIVPNNSIGGQTVQNK